MGKGGGCVPSKKKLPENRPREAPTSPPVADGGSAVEEEDAATDEVVLEASNEIANLKVYIVLYSMYDHVDGLARRLKKGVDNVDGVEGLLYRVPKTLSSEVLQQMKAPPKGDSVPEISASELVEADGVLFGFPTRYGAMAAKMKAFFNSTGSLWNKQKLAGKPAGFFVSTGMQGGGQETTAQAITNKRVNAGKWLEG